MKTTMLLSLFLLIMNISSIAKNRKKEFVIAMKRIDSLIEMHQCPSNIDLLFVPDEINKNHLIAIQLAANNLNYFSISKKKYVAAQQYYNKLIRLIKLKKYDISDSGAFSSFTTLWWDFNETRTQTQVLFRRQIRKIEKRRKKLQP